MVVLGVDGGTTKTIALIADERGQVLSASRGGGSNWTGEDVEIPMTVVANTVNEALLKAGLSGEDIAMGVFALAGADWPEDHTRREKFLSRQGLARQIRVKNDTFGCLRAGLRQPFGMVLAAGTGMNAAVIAPDGTEWAFGYYETYGGAVTIMREAFEAVLRAEDGRGQPTELTEMLLKHLDYPTVEAMLRASVKRVLDRGRFLAFTPLVFQAAFSGDAVAVDILVRQGRALAEYATAMARRFRMCDLAFDVVLAGSVFKGAGPLLVDTITQEIHQVAPLARVVRARFEPAVGSLLLAYDALGFDVTEDMYCRLEETTPEAGLFDTSGGVRPAPIWKEDAA